MKRKNSERLLEYEIQHIDPDDERAQLGFARKLLDFHSEQRQRDAKAEQQIHVNSIVQNWIAISLSRMTKFDPQFECSFKSCAFEKIEGLENYFGCKNHGRVHNCTHGFETCPPMPQRGFVVCTYTGSRLYNQMNSWSDEQEMDRAPTKRRGKGARSSDHARYLPDSMSKIAMILDDLLLNRDNRELVVRECVRRAERRSRDSVTRAFVEHMTQFDPSGVTPLPVFTDLVAVAQSAWIAVDIYGLPHQPITDIPREALVVPEYDFVWRHRLSTFVHKIWSTMEEGGMKRRTECLQELTLYVLYALHADHKIVAYGVSLGKYIPALDYLPPESVLSRLAHSTRNKSYDSTLYKKGRRVFAEQIGKMDKAMRGMLKKETDAILDGESDDPPGGDGTDRQARFVNIAEWIAPDSSKN